MYYSFRYGVSTMEDRVRLFKLVQVVKSVNGEGIKCKHGDSHKQVGHHAPATKQARIEMAYAQQQLPRAIRGQTVMHKGHGHHRLPMRAVRHPQATHDHQQQPAPRPLPVKQPAKGLGASFVFPSDGSNDQVTFRDGTGSPVFRCKKTLTFDLSSESDEDVFQTAIGVDHNEPADLHVDHQPDPVTVERSQTQETVNVRLGKDSNPQIQAHPNFEIPLTTIHSVAPTQPAITTLSSSAVVSTTTINTTSTTHPSHNVPQSFPMHATVTSQYQQQVLDI